MATSAGALSGRAFTVALRGNGVTPYEFGGFEGGVRELPARNAARAGRTIAVVFTLGGDFGLDIFAAGSPASGVIACGSTTPPAVLEPTLTAGDALFEYDPLTDRYTYPWQTVKEWAGTCRQLVLTLDDGSQFRANFDFR